MTDSFVSLCYAFMISYSVIFGDYLNVSGMVTRVVTRVIRLYDYMIIRVSYTIILVWES